jgi:hypothetical protein
MTRQTWEEERDARILARIEKMLERVDATLELILDRLPPPPQYLPTVGIVVIPVPGLTPKA